MSSKPILIKVDGIFSESQIKELSRLHVDIVGFPFDDGTHYADILALKKGCKDMQTCLAVTNHPYIKNDAEISTTLTLAISDHWDFVELQQRISTPSLAKLRAASMGIFVFSKGVDQKTVPSGITMESGDSISAVKEAFKTSNTYFTLDIDMNKKMWDSFANRPHVGDTLAIADIQELTRTYDIFLSMDFTQDNIFEIITLFPDAKGIQLHLDVGSDRYTYNRVYHTNTFNEIVDLVKIVKKV